MTKFNIDYEQLSKKVSANKVYRLAEVRHRIEKVAWDVVRFVDNSESIDNLWRIERQGNDDVIVAMYNEDGSPEKLEVQSQKQATASSNSWQVAADRAAANITIFYKGEPVKKVAAAALRVTKEDASIFCRHLSNKLATDKVLVRSMLRDLPESERTALLSKYPELNRE